ncbi:MAG: cofactor-independent phosphoglycerate mutase [Nitrospinota bacterium]
MNSNKRIILLGDGMPDDPVKELGGKTPLMAANTPNMDTMAREGTAGMVKTVPEGYDAGSDVTNMGILGYDPRKYYTGRAPLEAAAMGIDLGPDDVAYRCNLVSLAANRSGVLMEDFTAGHIESGDAKKLINSLNDSLGGKEIRFYSGVSYRHIMVWKNGISEIETTPPHDIIGHDIKDFLPKGERSEKLRHITGEAQILLKQHSINKNREAANKKAANSIWLWGQGKAPSMPKLEELRGLSGAMISAVDLMKGIGTLAGMEIVNVKGATGYIDTNYKGKAAAAIKALKEKDLVYLHVEAPDESGHEGSLEKKMKAIEDFDGKIVGPLLKETARLGGRAMALSDHRTPLSIRTHDSRPVPFAVWPKIGSGGGHASFDESIERHTSIIFEEGYLLFEWFIDYSQGV